MRYSRGDSRAQKENALAHKNLNETQWAFAHFFLLQGGLRFAEWPKSFFFFSFDDDFSTLSSPLFFSGSHA